MFIAICGTNHKHSNNPVFLPGGKVFFEQAETLSPILSRRFSRKIMLLIQNVGLAQDNSTIQKW
jgi:hypothetical protein